MASVAAMRAELRRWNGEPADETLSADALVFSIDAEALRRHWRRHPALATDLAETAVAEAGVRVPLSRERADAASGASAAGNASLPALIAARREALEAELDSLMLQLRIGPFRHGHARLFSATTWSMGR